MTTAPETKNLVRAYRVFHIALLAGLFLLGAVFVFLQRTVGARTGLSMLGLPFAGVAILLLAITAVLRARVVQRRADESPADYWARREIGAQALILWCLIDGSALLAWVGYSFSGLTIPLAVALGGTILLALFRPANLERAA